ncbi:MAG: undecaprenyldiphospho-muramoylpentapeptide beta-N-acetylglucosaminyltransferase [Flavobacteriales bacterium]
MKVIISGGGTGGHIFPAIAIARAIQEQLPETEILFVGAEGKMEMEKVPAAGYKIIGLPIVGIQRRFTLRNLLVPFKLMLSMLKAKNILEDFKPDVAVGVGGYASGPLLRAAAGAGISTLIQEQNSYPGITNKLLAKKVKRICVAYTGLEKYFPADKIIMTGNPVRLEMTKLEGKRARGFEQFKLDADKRTILIVGGSLGARTINLSVQRWAAELEQAGLQVLWQTGKTFFETAKQHVQSSQLQHIHVHEFIKEMDLAYACADIIVSRAGAMSIAELCLVKKPCILIPSPNVAEDHQTKNALALVQRNAAWLLKDAEAQEKLKSKVLALAADEHAMHTLCMNIAALGKPDAAMMIAREVITLAHNKIN